MSDVELQQALVILRRHLGDSRLSVRFSVGDLPDEALIHAFRAAIMADFTAEQRSALLDLEEYPQALVDDLRRLFEKQD